MKAKIIRLNGTLAQHFGVREMSRREFRIRVGLARAGFTFWSVYYGAMARVFRTLRIGLVSLYLIERKLR